MQVFIVSSKKIQDKNYETLFKWITTRNAGNIIGRIVLSVPPPWQVNRKWSIEHSDTGVHHLPYIDQKIGMSWVDHTCTDISCVHCCSRLHTCVCTSH